MDLRGQLRHVTGNLAHSRHHTLTIGVGVVVISAVHWSVISLRVLLRVARLLVVVTLVVVLVVGGAALITLSRPIGRVWGIQTMVFVIWLS